mmetsp:Transcript_28095/g.68309  ORF Transcript_28095/g.68309 Transcript_28095/m.68309 type:complete len:388 (+) Transcript_28095:571-1734(+)
MSRTNGKYSDGKTAAAEIVTELMDEIDDLQSQLSIKEGVIDNLSKKIIAAEQLEKRYQKMVEDAKHGGAAIISKKLEEKRILRDEIDALKERLKTAETENKSLLSKLTVAQSRQGLTSPPSEVLIGSSSEASPMSRGRTVSTPGSVGFHDAKIEGEIQLHMDRLKRDKIRAKHQLDMANETLRTTEDMLMKAKADLRNVLTISQYSTFNTMPVFAQSDSKSARLLQWNIESVDGKIKGKEDVHVEILVVDNNGSVLGNSSRTPKGNLRSPLYILLPPRQNNCKLIIQIKHLKRKKTMLKRSTIAWTFMKLLPGSRVQTLPLYKKPADFTCDKQVMSRMGKQSLEATLTLPVDDTSLKSLHNFVKDSLLDVTATSTSNSIMKTVTKKG